jgi:chromosome segregation protein
LQPHLFDTRAGTPSAHLLTAAALLLAAACSLAVFLSASPASATIASKQAALADVQDQQSAISDQLAGSNAEINSLIGQVSDARQAEAAAAAELQRLTLARQSLDEEEKRVLTARGAAGQRLVQLDQDRRREHRRHAGTLRGTFGKGYAILNAMSDRSGRLRA